MCGVGYDLEELKMKKHNLQFSGKDNNGHENKTEIELEVEMDTEIVKDAQLRTTHALNQIKKNTQNSQKNSKISPPLGRKIFKVNL